MTERILSPGVFTREVDLSTLPAAIAGRGPAIIGPTAKGPAMVPTKVASFAEFQAVFGNVDSSTYVPYAAQEYFKNGNNLTVVRPLHDDGYKASEVLSLTLSGSYGRRHIGLLHPAQYALDSVGEYDVNEAGPIFQTSTLVSASAGGSGVLTVSGSYTSYAPNRFDSNSNTYQISARRTNSNYIGRVFGKNAKAVNSPVYLYSFFENVAAQSLTQDPNSVIELTSASYSSQETFSNASTPWIISQTVNNSNYNLFRLHTLSDGDTSNYEIKLAISNVRAAGTVPGSDYGTFTLTIRAVDQAALKSVGSPYAYTDSDLRPTVLETYDNVSLDPNSTRYIARVIGDQYQTCVGGKIKIFGEYQNKSKYVYVEVDSDVASGTTSKELVPFGFAPLFATIPASLAGQVSIPGAAASLSIPNITASMWVQGPFSWQAPGTASGSAAFTIVTPNRNSVFIYGNDTGLSSGSFSAFVNANGTISYNSTFNTSGSIISAVSKMVFMLNQMTSFTQMTASVINSGQGIQITSTVEGTVGNSMSIFAHNGPQASLGIIRATSGVTAVLASNFPTSSYATDQRINGVYNRRKFYGFDYTNTDNLNYLKPIPVTAVTGSNRPFLLENVNQDSTLGYSGSIDLVNSDIESRKFIVPFQGGFDGCEPNRIILTGDNIAASNTQGYDLNGVDGKDYSVYKTAIDTLSNPDEVDFNLLVIPGVIQGTHTAIIEYASNMCQDRGDAMFVYDCSLPSTPIAAAIETIAQVDDNYAATYYPWARIIDTNVQKPVFVPPSTLIPSAFAYNDKVGADWFAPAGLNRGTLSSVIDVSNRLTVAERGTLQEGRINPLATLGDNGVVIWGQKTLQVKSSALDRINVRRMLIAVKKYVASITQYLVFEQNTAATRSRFLNIINPYLESIQQRQGLYAFKVIMDDTNNTSDLIDRNILYGQFYLQPTKTAEYILLDFNIMPTGATFPGN